MKSTQGGRYYDCCQLEQVAEVKAKEVVVDDIDIISLFTCLKATNEVVVDDIDIFVCLLEGKGSGCRRH